MDLRSLSLRWKMVLPAAVAVGATVVAIVVVAALMARARDRILEVDTRHFPALELSQEIERELDAIQRQLQDAVAAEDLGLVEETDELAALLARRVEEAPAGVLDAARRQELAASLRGYHALAREATALLVRHEKGDAAAAKVAEMSRRYAALREGLAAETAANRAAMQAAFTETARLQRAATLSVVGLLAAAAVAALLLALGLARATARPLEQLRVAAARVAEGDLAHAIQVGSRDEIGEVALAFARMVARLREIVATLKTSAADLAAAAEQLGEHTRAQTALLERQASAVAETSATMSELQQVSSVAAGRAGAVLEVATRAAEVSVAGRAAAERSVASIAQIQAAVASMVGQSTRLVDQARQIGPVVDTVKDLASMSNVLSLNASIEAARAGEAGRGFGVVAAEVRALAEQSVQSAGTIQKIVRDILQAAQAALASTDEGTRGVEGSVAEVRASGASLGEIGGIVQETGEAAKHIARAVQEQSAGIGQIAAAMTDLDKGMAETVRRLQGLREAAEGLTRTASRIAEVADGFRV